MLYLQRVPKEDFRTLKELFEVLQYEACGEMTVPKMNAILKYLEPKNLKGRYIEKLAAQVKEIQERQNFDPQNNFLDSFKLEAMREECILVKNQYAFSSMAINLEIEL